MWDYFLFSGCNDFLEGNKRKTHSKRYSPGGYTIKVYGKKNQRDITHAARPPTSQRRTESPESLHRTPSLTHHLNSPTSGDEGGVTARTLHHGRPLTTTVTSWSTCDSVNIEGQMWRENNLDFSPQFCLQGERGLRVRAGTHDVIAVRPER